VKDASPKRMRRFLVRASGAYALWRMRDGVPLLDTLRTSAVIGAAPSRGDTRENDGPTEVLVPTAPREERRLPEDQDAFHRHVTRRSRFAKGLLPPAFAPALSLTPPTRCPLVGDRCFCWALQGHGAVTRGSVSFESADVFFTRWNLRAWD
jgi:hypothetical protein